MITSVMPLLNIISLLVEHGCQDITPILDLSGCSEYPISMGGFGDVYRGRLVDSRSVAIKCMRMASDLVPGEQQKHLKYAAREVHTWSKIDHRYISKLIGLAQFRGQVAMVSVWAEHGSLPAYLVGNTKVNRPLLCTQAAEGLAFLHESGIANVLISETNEPMLTDFGNAVLLERTLKFTDTSSKRNLSLRWAAPELLEDGPYSCEADMYALGMTILEIITGDVPYEGMRDVSVVHAVISGRHPTRPPHIPSECEIGDILWALLARCWAFSPGSRPTASEVKNVMATVSSEGLASGTESVIKQRKRDRLGLQFKGVDETAREAVIAGRAMRTVEELIDTEKRYLNYLLEFQAECDSATHPAITENLPAMIEVSRAFIDKMDSDLSVQGMANAYLDVGEQLKTAFGRWASAVSRYEREIRTQSAASINARAYEMGIALMPTQRSARYALLYSELSLWTPDNSPFYPLVERAHQNSRRVATYCMDAHTGTIDIVPAEQLKPESLPYYYSK